MVSVKDGKSCFFWHDLWDDTICSQTFPELFSFAKNQNILVQLAATETPFHDQFHLPLPPEAYAQYLQLNDSVQSIQFQQDTDVWTYIWGSSTFSSRKAYKQLIGHRHIHQSFFLAMEIFLPKQEEILFLVNFARQAKYKSSTQKEEYAVT